MITKYKLFISLVLLVASLVIRAQSAPQTDSLSAYFEALTNIGQFNGVVLVKRGQSTELLHAYNMENAPEWARVNTQSQFHIASVRKLFNQYLVYQVAEQGYASSSVASLLNNAQLHSKWTPDMLLKHQSGLPRGEKFDFDKAHYDESELLALIAKQPLLFEPGEDTLYSNFGHLLIDLANGVWFDIPVSSVTQQKVFSPLNMINTVEINRVEEPINTNGMHFENGDPKPVNLSFYQRFPAGDVLSTVEDLDVFLRTVDPKVLGDENGIIEHAGAKRGYRSYVYFDTHNDVSFVMLSNHGEMPIMQTIKDVKQLLSGKSVALPQTIKRTQGKFQKDIANAIAGRYTLLVNQQVFDIVCENNQLYFVEQKGEAQRTRDPIYFESERTLFLAEDSADSLLVKGDAAPYTLFLTGYGNMEFEMSKMSEGKGCVQPNE